MAQPQIQSAFHKGEIAPALFARVDLAAYHQALATCRNFFVDYRGGVSTRPGTEYILQAYKSSSAVRLIPFQANFTTNYVLEFGDFYIRFYVNGSTVLETPGAITAATQANPCQITQVAHGYNTGDWVFITGVVGMTQLNGKYYVITKVDANNYTLSNLVGVAINSTGYTAYSSAGTGARVYTLPSPYAAADLATLKYAQNVGIMQFTHISYVPYVLTLISATNWTITPDVFGTTVATPSGIASSTTFGAGNVNYQYVVTAVDASGQESAPSAITTLSAKLDETTTRGTNQVTWSAVSGASYYNIYKARSSITTAIPAGSAYGFVGFVTGVAFNDINVSPDFSLCPPTAENPFVGAPVDSATITANSTYTTVPTASFAAPTSGATATGSPYLGVVGTPTVSSSLLGYSIGDALQPSPSGYGSPTLIVATVDGSGHVLTFQPMGYPGTSQGFIGSGSTPGNPVQFKKVGGAGGVVQVNLTWGVIGITINSGGSGYTSAPAITFSAGAATATAVLGSASSGNPSVCAYFQQRLVLAGPPASPGQFNMSQPGSYYNFDIHNPIIDSDAIEGTLASTVLNTIKALVPMQGGLLTLCDRQVFSINAGGNAPVTPATVEADSQSYSGCGDLPPIVSVENVLYVQAKGSVVRELNFNFYNNSYKGPDISIMSSHLFFSYTLSSWAFSEEPFKVVWAVRSDGTLLSLTYLKEQELLGWARHDTNGTFKSNCSVVEAVSQGNVDAHYVVVQRSVNGNSVQYIERMADRFWTSTTDPWCVDAGLNYTGSPATVFSGLEHLEGMTVTGIADGVSFGTKTVSGGAITLSTPASNVTVGLAFSPQIQTMPLDTGEPTIQGKPKKISGVSVRCKDTLGLNIGSSTVNQIVMKDTVIGNVGRQTNTVLTGLLTGDAWTMIDPLWQVPGQYYITQPNPYPATILGVIPEFDVGNTPK